MSVFNYFIFIHDCIACINKNKMSNPQRHLRTLLKAVWKNIGFIYKKTPYATFSKHEDRQCTMHVFKHTAILWDLVEHG